MKLSQLGEFGLIDRLAKIIGKPSSKVVLGIGDDCAVLELSKNKYQLVTTDTLIENVHFRINRKTSFFYLGRKAIAVNVSDIAAMGGIPTFAVVTIGAPSNFSVESLEDLYRGLKAESRKHQVSIVGGDTVRSPQELVISITLLGEVEKEYLLTRSGAKVGDLICVTGKFGGPASANYNSRYPLPITRYQEARTIAKSRLASSMIDSSDGLVRSVLEICKASKVGARVWEGKVPIAKGATLEQALFGGEEYELVFTLPRTKIDKLKKVKFSVVGEIDKQKNIIKLVDRAGQVKPLSAKGYEHFRAKG